MFFNSLNLKRRFVLGAVALAVTLPLLLQLNGVAEVRRFARIGVVVEAQIVDVHPKPKDRRAYSLFRYVVNEREFTGTVAGASERRVGDRLTITVDPANPASNWPAEAGAEVRWLVAESVLGAIWLALVVALFAGPRKEERSPRNHLLLE